MLAASFVKMLVFYACEFAVIVLVAIAGVFVGKMLRDRKNKENAEIENIVAEIESADDSSKKSIEE